MTLELPEREVDFDASRLCVRTVSADDWRASLELSGEIDLDTVRHLDAELARHFAAGRRVIRLDATALTFLDSTALGVILDASERCRTDHGSLILAHVPPHMRRLIDLTGLDTLLLIDTAADAS